MMLFALFAGVQKMTSVKTKLPLGLGVIHFIGIGGIGMSGIAEVLLSL